MDVDLGQHLKPTAMIDCEAKTIKEKARELTEGYENTVEKAKALFCFVRDEIKYNPYLPRYLPEQFQASNTLAGGQGYCVQKAALLVALARAVGIPARLGLAEIRNNLLPQKMADWMGVNVFPDHGYAVLHVEGKWVKATPAFDLEMCQQNRFIPVEFDGENDAMLPSHNQDGKLHIEYLLDRGYRDDVPVDEIWSDMIALFGTKYLEFPE
jgi:transglutaminase-like putative cysteine protease